MKQNHIPYSDHDFEGIVPRRGVLEIVLDESGAATAEYAIAILTAAGFAGLLAVILRSDSVRGWLTAIIEKALST